MNAGHALFAAGIVLLVLAGCSLFACGFAAVEDHAPGWLLLVVLVFGITGGLLVGGFAGAGA